MNEKTINVVDGQGLTTTSRNPHEVALYIILNLYEVNYDAKAEIKVDPHTGECAVTMDGNMFGKRVSISFTVLEQ